MEKIIKHRSELLNYFFNQDKEYTKLDILNKEYAALSFSPREEFIDNFITEYDDILTSFSDIDQDADEILVKGIVVDVDNKKGYSIIHIQNKADNISVSVDSSALYHYSQYLQKGHILLIKGHTFKGKMYMHFLIDYSSDYPFLQEHNYLKGISKQLIDDLDDNLVNKALVKQAKYFKSKKGNKCLRLLVYEKGKEKTYITCNNLPKNIVAGMFISYIPSNNNAFCNNVIETHI